MLGAPAPIDTKKVTTLSPPQMTSGVSMTTGMMKIGSELPSMEMMSSGGSSMQSSTMTSGGSSMMSSGGSSMQSFQSSGGSSMQSSMTSTTTGNKHTMGMSTGGLDMPMSIPGSSGPMVQTSIKS
jgi:hypothetical protein